jgi:hypothetical protein
MKNVLLAVIILGIGLMSCNKEVKPLTKEEILKTIDSLTTIRIRESDEMAKRDLNHRIKIEVKVKADSILHAVTLQKANDTLKSKKLP